MPNQLPNLKLTPVPMHRPRRASLRPFRTGMVFFNIPVSALLALTHNRSNVLIRSCKCIVWKAKAAVSRKQIANSIRSW